MTPEQKSALEGLLGRELTEGEITSIDPFLATDNRNDVKIASILSMGRNYRGFIAKAVFLRWTARTGVRAAIEDHATNVNSPLRATALSLRDFLWSDLTHIDFAMAENVTMLQAWVTANAITQAHADELLAMATYADPIHYSAVSDALNKAEGRLTMNQFEQGEGDPS